MREAQKEFDAKAAPLCPEHLSSPVLHRVLEYALIQQHIWGGKGVGSQASDLPRCCTPAAPTCPVMVPTAMSPRACIVIAGKRRTCCVRFSLQGDGTAQFVCRSQDDQAAVCQLLDRDLGMHCTQLTLQQTDDAQSLADAQVAAGAKPDICGVLLHILC